MAEGWEDLRAAFEQNFGQNLELGAQLAVFKDGVPVVDLHGYGGTVPKGTRYDGATLQNIFSSGKNLEARPTQRVFFATTGNDSQHDCDHARLSSQFQECGPREGASLRR